MYSRVELILGPPGTGKTTQLIQQVEYYLNKGIRPNKIGFMSFTKKAVDEAAQRAVSQLGINRRDFEFFRTTHSLCFRQLGMSKTEVMQISHYRELGKEIGIEITGSHKQDMLAYELNIGDQGIFIESLARLTCRDLKDTWTDFGSDISWLEVSFIARAVQKYKKAHLLFDYTDMLENFFKHGKSPELDVLIIDEAQDLCLLQWRIIERLIEKTEKVIIAGDDDQAIFKWSGAAIDYFVSLAKKIENTRVLRQSYRLPSKVKTFADSLILKVADRKVKPFFSTKEKGDVEFLSTFETINFDKGNWLILIRNGYFAKDIVDFLRHSGFVYISPYGDVRNSYGVVAALTWEKIRKGAREISKKERDCLNKYLNKNIPSSLENIDPCKLKKPWFDVLKLPIEEMEYYKSARRRGESFIKEPRIKISTIHGAKGAECDNVVVMTDMSMRTYNGYLKDQDSELRVFYVAATRAKKNLKIIQPQTNYFINI